MAEVLLPLKEVRARVGISTAAIYDRMTKGTFPQPCKVGARSLWVESEVEAWIAERIASRPVAGTVVGSQGRANKKAA